MNSRERVKAAIHFNKPDRLPHHLPDGKENDILWVGPHGLPDIQEWHEEDGRMLRTDCWGVLWETMGGGSFGEAVAWPLADITKHREYAFPELNNPELYVDSACAVEENNRQPNPRYCLGGMAFGSLYAGIHKLTGLGNMFVAFYDHPGLLKELIDRMAEAQRESIRLLHEAGCDGVIGFDDLGLQERLMVSKPLIEEFFVPAFQANWQYAQSLGMDVWLHSCGYTIELHSLFADIGLNVLQMDQQENMGLENIAAEAGGSLAYWCPVDIQGTMVYGTLDDIENYVKKMILTLGSFNGGLISMHYASPQAVGHTQERIDHMCWAFRKYEKLGLE